MEEERLRGMLNAAIRIGDEYNRLAIQQAIKLQAARERIGDAIDAMNSGRIKEAKAILERLDGQLRS
jgi:hypothetical protein